MPRRRGRVKHHETQLDPRYGNELAARMINLLMRDGKKSVAENIFYGAMDLVAAKGKQEPIEVFESAVRNVMPVLEVRPRRVGGANYQVPMEVRPHRRVSLAIRWLVQFAGQRSERTMIERIGNELLDAANETGGAVRRKEEVHRMAEANRAFAHYRW